MILTSHSHRHKLSFESWKTPGSFSRILLCFDIAYSALSVVARIIAWSLSSHLFSTTEITCSGRSGSLSITQGFAEDCPSVLSPPHLSFCKSSMLEITTYIYLLSQGSRHGPFVWKDCGTCSFLQ